jgi:hypothetical protein
MLASSAQLRLGIDTTNRDQYVFHPKLSAAGDFIPTVEWVFSQLDLKYAPVLSDQRLLLCQPRDSFCASHNAAEVPGHIQSLLFSFSFNL